MVTIFLQNKRFSIEREVPPKPPGDGVLLVHSDSVATSLAAFRSFRDNPSLDHFILVHKNPLQHLEDLKAEFRVILAGGGLVSNAEDQLLVIHRRGKWDLPKGKLDNGESPEEGALREVAEECGISGHRVEGFFARTWHWYTESEKDVLKETWWYRFSIPGIPVLTPQADEDITEAKWMSAKEVEDASRNTYGTIRELFKLWLNREGK